MGLFDFFKKDKPKGPDPVSGLTLSKMKPGYMVDYDLKTWEVTAYNLYDWGDGDESYEWQLKNGDDVRYLELETDDEEEWCLSRKVPFGKLGSGISQAIIDNGDPPDEITFDGEPYYLEKMAGGHFLKDGKGIGQPLLSWDYENDEGDKYLSVEQWGEEDFEASQGIPVEEYQFTNILPVEEKED